MKTMKHMGRHQLVQRLAAQVGSEAKAKLILKRRGQMDSSGNLTAEGRKRDAMTAAERAVDRASSKSGRSAAHYKYSPETNRATLVTRKRRGFRRRKA